MRRDDEPGLTRLERRQLVEVGDLFGAAAEIEQKDMLAANRALDARNERDAALDGVRRVGTQIELTIVERNRQGVIAQAARPDR